MGLLRHRRLRDGIHYKDGHGHTWIISTAPKGKYYCKKVSVSYSTSWEGVGEDGYRWGKLSNLITTEEDEVVTRLGKFFSIFY